MTQRTISVLLLSLVFLSLPACNLAPKYNPPPLPVNKTWPGEGEEIAKKQQKLVRWQKFFKSPALHSVIKQTLANNRDLRVAILNIESAQAAYQISRAELVPAVNAQAGLTRAKVPATISATGKETLGSEYTANLGITAYELDLFGRVRNMNKMALENYFATIEARNAVQITLIAATASAYIQWLGDLTLYDLASKNYDIQVKNYNITKTSFAQGLSSKMDLMQAKTAMETAKVSYEAYTAVIAQDKNALQLLMGTTKEEALPKDSSFDKLIFPDKLLVDIPAVVLLARPDIKQAEHNLKAQNANIGVARAAFFPTISLTASYGFASKALNGLFKGGSSTGAWNFAPAVSLPIFPQNTNFANLKIAEAERKIAVATYEKAIQTAFAEVADALATRKSLVAEVTAEEDLVKAQKKIYDLALMRYKIGLDSYPILLTAEQALIAADQKLITTKQQQLINYVNLYKALGGGN